MKIETKKFIVIFDFLIRYLFQIAGLYILFYIMHIIGSKIFDSFNSDLLFSIFILPLLEIIKYAPKNLIYPYTVKITLTEKHITITSGIYHTFKDCIELKNIENIETYQSLFAKVFGFYTVTVKTYGNEVELPFVKTSENLEQKINKLKEKKARKK